MVTSELQAAPVSPGAVLREEIVARTGLTQDALAEALGVSRYSVNQIINDRRSITADMALRLAKVLGTTPQFWLNLQMAVDLFQAFRKLGSEIERLPVLKESRADAERFLPLRDLLAE